MPANFSAINTIYNHYMTSYAPKGTTPFDTHKKSELRGIYNSIVKMNKEAPLCLVNTEKETQEFAIGMKENARAFRNTLASLGGLGTDEFLNKKIAYSSDPDIAQTRYIGSDDNYDSVPALELEVSSLASEQVNMGNVLPSGNVDLPSDTYSFDIKVNDLSYEFQFNINTNDTNRDVQNRLSRLITNSSIGLTASTVDGANGGSYLKLQSLATGTPKGRELIFTISDNSTSKQTGAVDYFGIGEASKKPTDAQFAVNGIARSASSNNFTIDKTYEVNLTGISPNKGQTTSIGLKTDLESLTENLNQMADGYNSFIKAANEYTSNHPRTNRLMKELGQITSSYENGLNTAGFTIQEDGTISLDKELFSNIITKENAKEILTPTTEFAQSVLNKANQVSLNPMEYVEKTIIAYKNPGKSYSSPYITSAYSGMMFNGYC